MCIAKLESEYLLSAINYRVQYFCYVYVTFQGCHRTSQLFANISLISVDYILLPF